MTINSYDKFVTLHICHDIRRVLVTTDLGIVYDDFKFVLVMNTLSFSLNHTLPYKTS